MAALEQIAAQLTTLLQRGREGIDAELQRNNVQLAAEVATVKTMVEHIKEELSILKEMEVVGEVAALTAKIDAMQMEMNVMRNRNVNGQSMKVDTRQMKPRDYIGDKSEVHFVEWAFKFMMYASANNKEIGILLEWAMKEKEPIDNSRAQEKMHELGIDDTDAVNHYVYSCIASCLGGEAMTFILTMKREDPSIEVWRRMAQRCDPDTAKAQTMGIKGLLNRPKVKGTKDLVAAIEKWESELRNYEVRTRDTLQDSVKQETLNGMLPSDIEQKIRMEQAMGRAKDYASMREAVMTYVRNMSTAASALDVGKVDEETGVVNNHNDEYGHEEYETNYAGYEKGYNGGKGKGKPMGKGWQFKAAPKGQHWKGDQKGKGFPKGKGKDSRVCHNCGQVGHIALWCPAKQSQWIPYQKGGKGTKGWHNNEWNPRPLYAMGEWSATPHHDTTANWETGYDDHEQHYDDTCQEHGHEYCAFGLTVEETDERVRGTKDAENINNVNTYNRYDPIANDDDEEADEDDENTIEDFPSPSTDKTSVNKSKKMPRVARGRWTVVEDGKRKSKARQLSLLTKEEDKEECIDTLGHIAKGGWVRIKGTVDSGAAEHVANRDHFPQFEVMPAKKNVRYVTANGERIPHAGEQRVVMTTNEGSKRSIDFQLSEVDKPLLGANKICKKGHYIILDEDEGWIINKRSGECTRLEVEDGTYKMHMWVRDFHRPATHWL